MRVSTIISIIVLLLQIGGIALGILYVIKGDLGFGLFLVIMNSSALGINILNIIDSF